VKAITAALAGLLAISTAHAQSLPSETPKTFTPVTKSFDYDRRDVMIPMRDGIKLHTVILVPRNAHHAPILLTRTPYDATELTSYNHSGHLIASLDGYDNADDLIVDAGYIRVVQDVRGKYKSEGDYVMNRPLIGPLNDTKVDHTTDTYDTIEWLIHNIPETNGRVGTIGISYDGFTTLMSLIHPHPALKVAVPMNPMVDGWIGDDWFHRGAFRQLGSLNYIYEQEATRANDEKWWTDHYDDYDAFMEIGSAGAMAATHGEEQVGFYNKLTQHTTYDEFWKDQAMDKLLAKEPLTVPTMLVHSLWDQEDIYGAPAVYKALHAKNALSGKLYLVLGPWHHGQEIDADTTLGDIGFGSDTGLYFRHHILRPFLDHYLKDGAPPMDVAQVNAFESGTNHWLRLRSWPQGCESDCPITPTAMHLLPGGTLSSGAVKNPNAASTYTSDPAKPVPFIQRPIHLLADGEGMLWRNWLASDQREASTRPDVLTFETDRLTAPVKISGEPTAKLVASITGTDVDFVVKVIDVYPDEVAQKPELGGYQLMVSADILRGRFRNAFDKPEPVPADTKQNYNFSLPNANHVFLPGHRIMVQVQSTWFPLYDRNPQTFVDNIFFAKPTDYHPIGVTIFADSTVELPIVKQ
jgi:putative CocE/NonD family hydrolase